MALTLKLSGRRLLLSMGVIAALVGGTTACTDDKSDTGKVVSITDGDTLVATVNGKDQTIRLLNIDTPETKDPNKPTECLGAEATSFLSELLPVNSTIKLMYDEERTDKYGRTLAAVFTASDAFVSAEIARAGLGTAVVFGKNSKFLPPVQDAEKEAKDSSRGLHDPVIDCTLPAQIATATQALETAAAAQAGSTAAATGAVITGAAASIATARALKTLLQSGRSGTDVVRWAALDELELKTHIKLLSTKIAKAESNHESLTQAKSALSQAEAAAAAKAQAEAAAAAKAQAEAAAAAKAQAEAAAAAKAQAEAAAQQKAAEAEAERIRNLPPVYVPPAPDPYVPPVYQPPAQNSGGGSDRYTGPRCYAPGGKTYRPC
ncbi:thermonuclease family protein [Arthrobacter sp. LAPM80]|uniref:thermonuclease family protein n=1 Tax=Arthrobacter sp. LAPM80 TaxID=3141788 RepID=UPI00398AB87E